MIQVLSRTAYLAILITALIFTTGCPPGSKDKSDKTDTDTDTDTHTSTKPDPVEVCSEKVPADALVTCKRYDSMCPSQEKWTYIANEADLPAGTSLKICGLTVPAGWKLVGEPVFESCCGATPSPNAINITKL